jgi:hypothetical protein
MPSVKPHSSKTRLQQTNHGTKHAQPGIQQLPPVPWKTAAAVAGASRSAPSGVAAAVSEVSAAVEELHAQLEVSSSSGPQCCCKSVHVACGSNVACCSAAACM